MLKFLLILSITLIAPIKLNVISASSKYILSDVTSLKKASLYIIQRNKNRNTVCYDVNLLPNGDIDINNPLDCYWKMVEKNGLREELTIFEKATAYGYDVEKSGTKGFYIKMNALKDRKCYVYKGTNGQICCVTLINGKMANLKRIYVQAKEGFSLDAVKFIELNGKDLISGVDLFEKIENN